MSDLITQDLTTTEPQDDTLLPRWQQVWRKGFAPQMCDASLSALRDALATNDVRLIQGSTTNPPPLMCVQDWPVEGACAVSLCGWLGHDLRTVGDVEQFFNAALCKADDLLGEPAECRWFLNWFDDTPRDRMRQELLAEVIGEIARRQHREEVL